MGKIIALAFSDLHVNKWKVNYQYTGDRLKDSLEPLRIIGKRAGELGVSMLFSGDLLHKPSGIDNGILEPLIDTWDNYIKTNVLAISGNHDQSEKNTPSHKSPSYVRSLSKVLRLLTCLDNSSIEIANHPSRIWGIPYLTANVGFKEYVKEFSKQADAIKGKFKILLIHTDLPGAKNGFGYEIGEAKNIPTNLNKFFKSFDLVLCGHIHKAQKLANNVYMLGATTQQDAGDCGVDMGYWEIWDDREPKFVKLKLPEFIYLQHDEAVPVNGKDIYIHLPKPKANKALGAGDGFNNKTSKSKIAKSYLKKKGIKSKSKSKALITALNQ